MYLPNLSANRNRALFEGKLKVSHRNRFPRGGGAGDTTDSKW